MHGTGTATLVGRAHFTLQIKRKERRWETTNRTAKKRKRHTTKDSREKKKLIKIDMVLCIYIRERELCVHDQLAGIDYAMQIRSLRFNTFLGKERCRVLSLCDMPPHTTNAAVFVTRKPNLFFFSFLQSDKINAPNLNTVLSPYDLWNFFFLPLSFVSQKSFLPRPKKKKDFFFSEKKTISTPLRGPSLQLRHKTIVYDFFSLVFYTYITPSPMLGESKNKFVTVRNSRFQRVVVQHWGVRFNPERIFFF